MLLGLGKDPGLDGRFVLPGNTRQGQSMSLALGLTVRSGLSVLWKNVQGHEPFRANHSNWVNMVRGHLFFRVWPLSTGGDVARLGATLGAGVWL